MSFFGFVFRATLYFSAVLGVGAGMLILFVGGGIGRSDVTMVREGFGQIYVTGLRGVEQTARRLRGDFCQVDDAGAPFPAECIEGPV